MIITLNDNWTFFKGTSAPAAAKSQPPAENASGEKVTLPHTWNAFDGQDGGSDYFRGECTYTRPLPALTLKEDEEVYLCFYGVSQTAEVFISGELVTRHEGGYSRFYADVTRFFRTASPLPPSLREVSAQQTEGVTSFEAPLRGAGIPSAACCGGMTEGVVAGVPPAALKRNSPYSAAGSSEGAPAASSRKASTAPHFSARQSFSFKNSWREFSNSLSFTFFMPACFV